MQLSKSLFSNKKKEIKIYEIKFLFDSFSFLYLSKMILNDETGLDHETRP